MKILLAAYEFPPSGSPQALRWQALSRELVALGHQVTVLTASGTSGGADTVACDVGKPDPAGLQVVRTPAEPLGSVLRWLRGLVPGRRGEGPVIIPRSFDGLNWKGRIVAAIGWMQAWSEFPDSRARWNRTAIPRLESLIRASAPDVVVTSHEPASVLEMGRVALRAGIPWVADLGDPVVADYLPKRWRRRAWRLEREVCNRCSLVAVTTRAYGRLLEVEHGLDPQRCVVLRQGYTPARPAPSARASDGNGTLELLYTGQLYGFRSPDALLQALEAVEGARLTVLSPQADVARPFAGRLGKRLRLMAPVPAASVGQWQRDADILVNIGNTMPLQMPGKLFEYLGSGRPVLHLSACEPDESSDLVRAFRRGWVVHNDVDAIRTMLLELLVQWRSGCLHAGLDLSDASVGEFSWPMIAAHLSDALAEAVEQGTRRVQA